MLENLYLEADALLNRIFEAEDTANERIAVLQSLADNIEILIEAIRDSGGTEE